MFGYQLPASVCLVALLVASGFGGERFSLDVPGQPGLRSTAVADSDRLDITDAAGRTHRYVRDKNADSRDGKYWGYYCAALRKYIRFPVAGAGAMQIADKDGSRVWQTSQMQVSPLSNVSGGRTTTRRPVGNRLGLGSGRTVPSAIDPFGVGQAGQGRSPFSSGRRAPRAAQFAVLPIGSEFSVCSLDRSGALQFYFGRGTQWRQQTVGPVRGIDFEGSFVLAANPQSQIPTVYGVSTGGELLSLTNGRDVRNVFGTRTDAPRFPRGTHLSTFDNGRMLLAVDDRARCLLIVGSEGRFVDAGPFRYRAIPGSPVYATRDGNNSANVFLIDRDGQIVQLRVDSLNRWDEQVIGQGFSPGGHLAINQFHVAGRPAEMYLASVDARGTVQILREPFQRRITVSSVRLGAGTPLALAQNGDGELTLAAVDPQGTFAEWSFRNTWVRRDVGPGFDAGAPVWFRGTRPACFAINRRGALISGHFIGNRWSCHTCGTVGGLAGYVAPRVVSSEFVPLPPLPPVTIELQNRHKEDLVIQWVDALKPTAQPETIEIKAGASVARRINRNPGASQVETFAVQRLDGSIIEEVREYGIPAQTLYTLAVFENRVQSVYIDRTGKDPNAGKITKGLRSLGVFRLPPGDLLREGTVIDVYAEAATRNNPGAVRLVP